MRLLRRAIPILAKLSGAIMFYACLHAPARALEVNLHPAEVNASVVRLSDVAELVDVPAHLSDSLSRMVVGFSPAPGGKRTLAAATLRMQILGAGFLPAEVRVNGADPVITRRGQTLAAEAVSAAGLQALAPRKQDGLDFTITRIPGPLMLPQGEVQFTVEAPTKLTSNFFVTVIARVGEEQLRFFVSLRTAKLEAVLVAVRRIDRGALLTAADVKLEKRDILNRRAQDYLVDPGEAIGRRAKRPFTPGMMLAANCVEGDQLVKRGDRVRLVVRIPGVELSSVGEAYDGGGMGDSIRVRNLDSRKIIMARVTGAGEVCVVE